MSNPRRRRPSPAEIASAITEVAVGNPSVAELEPVPTPPFETPPEPPPQPEPPARVKKRTWSYFLTPSVAGMLSRWPNNDSARAMVSAQLEVTIPPEADTWEKIVDWLEYDAVLPAEEREKKEADEREKAALLRANQPKLILEVKVLATEFGRCDYLVNKAGSGPVELLKEEVEGIIHNNYANEVVSSIRRHIRDSAYHQLHLEDVPDTESHSDYEESEDSPSRNESTLVAPRAEASGVIMNYLRENFPDWWRANHSQLVP